MIGETYAVGDGTDNWCESDNLVDEAVWLQGIYVAPTCALVSCLEFREGGLRILTGDNFCNVKGINNWAMVLCSD
jgi:hypothetical protein